MDLLCLIYLSFLEKHLPVCAHTRTHFTVSLHKQRWEWFLPLAGLTQLCTNWSSTTDLCLVWCCHLTKGSPPLHACFLKSHSCHSDSLLCSRPVHTATTTGCSGSWVRSDRCTCDICGLRLISFRLMVLGFRLFSSWQSSTPSRRVCARSNTCALSAVTRWFEGSTLQLMSHIAHCLQYSMLWKQQVEARYID